MNTFYKNLSMWLVIGLTMILLFQLFNKPQTQSNSITYSEFWSNVESGAISKVSIQGEEITGIGKDGRPFKTMAPDDAELIPMLRQSDVDIMVKKPEEDPLVSDHFCLLVPDAAPDRRLDFLHAPDADGRQGRGSVLRQDPGKIAG